MKHLFHEMTESLWHIMKWLITQYDCNILYDHWLSLSMNNRWDKPLMQTSSYPNAYRLASEIVNWPHQLSPLSFPNGQAGRLWQPQMANQQIMQNLKDSALMASGSECYHLEVWDPFGLCFNDLLPDLKYHWFSALIFISYLRRLLNMAVWWLPCSYHTRKGTREFDSLEVTRLNVASVAKFLFSTVCWFVESS